MREGGARERREGVSTSGGAAGTHTTTNPAILATHYLVLELRISALSLICWRDAVLHMG